MCNILKCFSLYWVLFTVTRMFFIYIYNAYPFTDGIILETLYFCLVLTYFTYLPLSVFISGTGCLDLPVPDSMAIVMNSSAISRSSPVYV